MERKNYFSSRGQVILLSVIILGGILLSAGAIGGLLMHYQIRSLNDAVNSAKAIFAADAALEWQTYRVYKGVGGAFPVFSNGASATSTAINITTSSEVVIRAQGYAGNVARALEVVLIALFEQTFTCHVGNNPPTAQCTIRIDLGQSTSTLTWSAQGTSDCTGTSDTEVANWTNTPKPIIGSEDVAPDSTTRFFLTCVGTLGVTTSTVQVNVENIGIGTGS